MPKWTGAAIDEPPNVMIDQQSANVAMKKGLYDIHRPWMDRLNAARIASVFALAAVRANP